MHKIARWLVTLLMLLAVAGGGYWYYRQRAASRASAAAGSSGTFTQVVAVTTGSLNSAISVVGALEAVQSADLAFEHLSQSTKLASLDVQAGNTVAAGQVLARVDPAPYQQALDQAKSDLAAAQETLADLKTPATPLAIAQADLAVVKAQYTLQEAQDTLADLVRPDIPALESAVAEAEKALAEAQAGVLAQEETTSTKDELDKLVYAESTPTAEYNRLAAEKYSDEYYQDRLELAYNKMRDVQDPRVKYQLNARIGALQAQMSVRSAEKTLADAQEALGEARAGGDPLALAKAQVAVQSAQVSLQSAQQDRQDLDDGADATEVATAQADVDKKRLAVDDAQIDLAATQIVAPFAGTILETQFEPGDQVSAGAVVLSIANLNTLQVVASVDETTIRRVAAGQPAQITFDAFPGQPFPGKVGAVPLQGTLQGGVMVYDVPVSLSGTAGLALLVGMTANVEIQVAQVANALLVPTMALQKANGLYQVLVPNSSDPNGPPESVPVEVGLSDGTYTQITKGLNPNDHVVLQIQANANQNNRFRGMGGNLIIQTGRQLNGR